MAGSLMLNANYTIDLLKMVRSSLESIRTMLGDWNQPQATLPEIQQLEQLEDLFVDQAIRLDAINRVLDEFNYSVAHELFAPLRRISGFTSELKLRCAEVMGPEGIDCLSEIMESTQQMNDLIDALMQLSRLAHLELQRVSVDLSGIAGGIAEELTLGAPQRAAVFKIAPQLCATGDPNLLKTALRNLLDNAWKFTAKREMAVIEFGCIQLESGSGFYLKDNGVGFDMAEYGRLFHPFQQLHAAEFCSGNGMGLTAVKRIVERHGGRIWAEAAPDQGATFFFTL